MRVSASSDAKLDNLLVPERQLASETKQEYYTFTKFIDNEFKVDLCKYITKKNAINVDN